jgi:hypothetical protein
MNKKVKLKKMSRFKTEVKVFLVCLISAGGLVIYSVYGYDKGFNDLINQLHIVFLGALAIYFLILAFRIIFWVLYKIVK